jgi:AcrR family transcriptional regulator
MARPTKAEAGNTRSDILSAALDSFSVRGFFGTSMREIARAVGVREGALYHYFPSKDSILEELLQLHGPGKAKLLDSLDVAALASEVGCEELLRNMVRMLVVEWASPDERKIAKIILTEGARIAADGRLVPQASFQVVRAALGRLFQVLIDEGHLEADDPRDVALAFLGPLMALRISLLVVAPDPPDLATLQREAEAHVRHFWKKHRKAVTRSRIRASSPRRARRSSRERTSP